MALNHHWQPKLKQLTFQLGDPTLQESLLSIARTKEEWEVLRAEKAKRDLRRKRTLAYGKRFRSLRRS
jgi:hypothetical protein